jgi:hypothetical protein
LDLKLSSKTSLEKVFPKIGKVEAPRREKRRREIQSG